MSVNGQINRKVPTTPLRRVNWMKLAERSEKGDQEGTPNPDSHSHNHLCGLMPCRVYFSAHTKQI